MHNHTKRTYMAKASEHKTTWFLLDAKGKTLGRFAAEIAKILRGKHRPDYTPHANTGDGVIVINAKDICTTGAKEANKLYRYYTGYIGGLREIPYREMKDRKPGYILEHAVKGMVPRTKQGRAQMKKLRIFADDRHQMQAQQPITLDI